MRQLVLGAGLRDWVVWAAALTVGVLAALYFGLLTVLIGAAVGGRPWPRCFTSRLI